MSSTTTSIPVTAGLGPEEVLGHSTILLRRLLQGLGVAVLLGMLALYIPGLPPKLLIVACLGIGLFIRRDLFDRGVWPLVAICLYSVAMSAAFSGYVPGMLDIFQNPGFQLLGVLLLWGCLRGCGVTGLLALLYACLAISFVGAVGDLLGHDMTQLLPISAPDDEFFDAITSTSSGEARVRGFFPEASILGAISVSFSFVAMASSLILARMKSSGWACLAVAISGLSMLAFLGVTLAKTGIVMFVLGMLGFAVVNLWFGSWGARTRMLAMLAVVTAFSLAVVMSDTSLGGYLREEAEGVPIPKIGTSSGKVGAGAQTRVTSWKLAWVNLKAHPFGVGHWGLSATVSAATGITPDAEMLFWFQRDNFSLKCALANVIAETGLVGMGLLAFWMFANFVAPAFAWRKRFGSEHLGVAGLYAACMFISLGLFVTCELYPYLAFALLLKMVADAVAASVRETAEQS
jgi:hypothetical protein